MADADKAEARRVGSEKQARITKQWSDFSRTEAYKDLMEYCDGLKEMYIKYCEDQAMPHPTKTGDVVPLGNDMIASLLQARRGAGMIQTYISNRVDTDVAQPIKPSK
jgi:hypothetical protein